MHVSNARKFRMIAYSNILHDKRIEILRKRDGATINLAGRDIRHLEFLTLSRMSLKLHSYEV